jgi:aminomethyltransferase
MTPFAAGLGKFIDLDKEGFVGREALLAADRRSRLLGLTCETATPADHGAILEASLVVGQVTAAAWSPTLDLGIGYARFDNPADWIGQTLTVETEGGLTAPCEIVELPFYDTEKRIPRGLE